MQYSTAGYREPEENHFCENSINSNGEDEEDRTQRPTLDDYNSRFLDYDGAHAHQYAGWGTTCSFCRRKGGPPIFGCSTWISRKVTASSTVPTRLHKGLTGLDTTVTKNYRCVLECCKAGNWCYVLVIFCSWH